MDVLFRNQFSAAQIFAAEPGLQSQVRVGFDAMDSSASGAESGAGIATSFAVLDAFLPWRGWPVGAMSEIMTDRVGCGEMSLVLPAMARLSQEKRQILCVGAPHELFASALIDAGIDPARVTQINAAEASHSNKKQKENLWCTEQILKTGLPGMVLLWSRNTCTPEVLRRLQLAMMNTQTVLIHFRSNACMQQHSPAWLRCGFAADDVEIQLQILKCRGRLLTRPLITLDRAAVQRRLYAQFSADKALRNAVAHGMPINARTSVDDGMLIAKQPGTHTLQ
ncbi:MAG: translesion DNA synthesis-associated protein ImuA [Betaproteobacteria bacterium]|nr:MAG: translesion DNA synthesis-associated protein ImuA [Betaproteobacteria bacterium]